MRPSGRTNDQLRPINITPNYTKHAEGSVLVEYGDTKVLCTASISNSLPRFLREKNGNQGWITAEYGMLPRSTHSRVDREAARGKQTGRTLEIQRLIGRALRSAVDLKALGEVAIQVDCDVIQADGGTRTAAITGSSIAVANAISYLHNKGKLNKNPLRHLISAVSVGIYQDEVILDLDYDEDSKAETDMNIVMNDQMQFIELQGTAEGQTFDMQQLQAMLEIAQTGIKQIQAVQKQVLGIHTE